MGDLTETISTAKEALEAGRTDLLATFAHVPGDRLTWSPGGQARSALWIVGHCAASTEAFATLVRGETVPFPDDPAEAARMIRDGGRDVATREEAVSRLEAACAAFAAALDTLTPERMGQSSETPFGPLPVALWPQIAGPHLVGHARQIDYLETIWGDVEDHR